MVMHSGLSIGTFFANWWRMYYYYGCAVARNITGHFRKLAVYVYIIKVSPPNLISYHLLLGWSSRPNALV